MNLNLKTVRKAERQVREMNSDLSSADFDGLVQQVLEDWAIERAHSLEAYGEPEDTPCFETGRDNCDDWGTGEGQYHGRI